MKKERVFVDRDGVFASDLFWSMPKATLRVYVLFRDRCRWVRIPGKKGQKVWTIANNGEIVFPYREAKKKYGFACSTFQKAIDSLVKYGFIYIKHGGGAFDGDTSKYGISHEWKHYDTEKFKGKDREKDTRKVGFRGGGEH